MYFNIIIHYYY